MSSVMTKQKLGVLKKFGRFPRYTIPTKHGDVMDMENINNNQQWHLPIIRGDKPEENGEEILTKKNRYLKIQSIR